MIGNNGIQKLIIFFGCYLRYLWQAGKKLLHHIFMNVVMSIICTHEPHQRCTTWFSFLSKQLGEGGRKGLGCWWHNNLLKPKMHMKHTKNVQLDFSFLSSECVGMLVTQHAVYIFSVLVWYQLLNNLVMVSDFFFFLSCQAGTVIEFFFKPFIPSLYWVHY